MRIEPEIWQALKEMAAENGVTIKALVEKIAIAKKPSRSLSSEIRVFVAGYFRGGETFGTRATTVLTSSSTMTRDHLSVRLIQNVAG